MRRARPFFQRAIEATRNKAGDRLDANVVSHIANFLIHFEHFRTTLVGEDIFLLRMFRML
jgi:hypothetical protein